MQTRWRPRVDIERTTDMSETVKDRDETNRTLMRALCARQTSGRDDQRADLNEEGNNTGARGRNEKIPREINDYR